MQRLVVRLSLSIVRRHPRRRDTLPHWSHAFSSTPRRFDALTPLQLSDTVQNAAQLAETEAENDSKAGRRRGVSFFQSAGGQALAASVIGVAVLGLGGVAYLHWYKYDVLRKMMIAFEPGNDPVLVLDEASKAARSNRAKRRAHENFIADGREEDEVAQDVMILRPEQGLIDRIVHGDLGGSYWLLTGPKGTGKFSLICTSMAKNQAAGVAVCEAHHDPEVFRLRLCKALNYENNEDWIGGLFSRRDPREAGPMLDFERAMNKLEKVAIKYYQKTGKPLVMVFNNIQNCSLLNNDEDSHSLLHLLQQRAESWAQAGVLTMVFNSDDHWPYLVLRKNASRMSVLTVRDLDRDSTIKAIRMERKTLWGEKIGEVEAEQLWNIVGGRLSHLSQCVKRRDMLGHANSLMKREQAWLLSRIGLIVDCDDDVMDEQKFSSSSLLLLQALSKQADEESEELGHEPHHGYQGVTYEDARQIMTRADFLPQLDHENIISIDIDHVVRADSPLVLNAVREVCRRPDFQERLDSVLERINAIESLGRTRELIWKEGADGPGILNVRMQTASLET